MSIDMKSYIVQCSAINLRPENVPIEKPLIPWRIEGLDLCFWRLFLRWFGFTFTLWLTCHDGEK